MDFLWTKKNHVEIGTAAQIGLRENIGLLKASIPRLKRVVYVGSSTLPRTLTPYMDRGTLQEALDERRSLLAVINICIARQFAEEEFPCEVAYCNLFQKLSDAEILDKYGHLRIESFVGRFTMQHEDLLSAMQTPLPKNAGGCFLMRTDASRRKKYI